MIHKNGQTSCDLKDILRSSLDEPKTVGISATSNF